MTLIIGLIVSIVLGSVCYFSTVNIYTTVSIFVLSLLYFLIYANRKIKSKNTKIHRFHECYHFINNFLIALSIKGHISGALSSALESQEKDLIESLNELTTNDPMFKIKYLKNYFLFDAYSIFYDIVSLYEDEGGEIINMSHLLSNQIRETEDYLVNVERLHKDALIEFSVLWIFALIILVVLRLALIDFFALIIKGITYQISVALILLFVLISIHIALVKTTDIKIKGWDKNV